MSTKTLKKRIALVAVSALTAGFLSVASAPVANAAVAADSLTENTLYLGITKSVTGSAGATDKTPVAKAATTVSAMRLRSVFVDIYFLSLVRIRNFLNLARRSFDLLIPFPCGTHV